MADWRPLERVQAVFSPTAALQRGTKLMAAGKTGPAFQLYARAGRTGLAEAEYRVGRCYLDGVGVPPSRAEGIRWLERAADHDHVEAQSQLAIIYLHGAAGAPDPKSAASLFDVGDIADPDYVTAMRRARKAAEAGSGEAQAVLGFILTSGPPDMRNVDEADLWYERSAAAGCPQGMLGHAQALNRKGGDQTVKREVAVQLGKAAEAGLPAALYLLGVMSERGLGVSRDEEAAAELYRRAAEKGHRSGQARWGKALMHGIGVDANPSDGETWLRRAALAGDSEAAAALGDLHAAGGNLPPNHAEAASWFRRAAEAGHKSAARSLGLLYFAGAGVPYDPEQGMRWFRISAAAGDGPARSELGNLLLTGMGEEDDRVRIYKGFEQAAASGDLVAAYNCAVCLSHGVGVARDDREAALWLHKAANQVPNAQFWYGRILVEGRGVDRDLAEGRRWIARAAETGMVDAQVALGEMMLTGTGGACDPPGALALFEKAAAKGHLAAMFAAGIVYGGAHGVPANHGAAQRWFHTAADHGHPAAQMMLERHIAANAADQVDPDDARHRLGEPPADAPKTAGEDVAAPSAEVAGDAAIPNSGKPETGTS
jgi:TPR repeat protein